MSDIFIDSIRKGLHGAWSHPDPFTIFDEIDWETAGEQVEGKPHTIWQLMRHMNSWGWICVNKIKGVEVAGIPDENNYFPVEPDPASEDKWNANLMAWKSLAEEAGELLENFDPAKQILEWDNMTHADAMMVLITHNSYHSSQVVALRKALGVWKEKIGSGEL